MKKNILVSCMSLTVGGGEILPMSLAAELSKTNNVYLFYHMDVEENEGLVKRLIPPEVKILSLRRLRLFNSLVGSTHSLLRRLNIRWSAYDFFRLRILDYYVRKYNIEIISSHSMISDEACCHLFYNKKPIIVTEHGQYALQIADGKKAFAAYLKKATVLVAVSKFNKKLLSDNLGADFIKIETIYNGIKKEKKSNENFRKDYSISEDAFIFGMVSRGIPEKGWIFAIEAFLSLRKEGFENTLLVLVGGSDYMDELKKKYSSEGSIIFTGSVPNPDHYIKGFNVGLMPTIYATESFPLAIIEYLFDAKPVIATDTGGIREMLCDGDINGGQLIPLTENKNLFAENICLAMKEYLVNTSLYNKHSNYTSKLAERFTITECAHNYEKLFEETLKRKTA